MTAGCQCHSPGFILRLLYGSESAQRVEAWLKGRLSHFVLPRTAMPSIDDGSLSAELNLAGLGLSTPAGMMSALDVILEKVEAGKQVLRLTDLGSWTGGELHSPAEHLLLRYLRAFVSETIPGVLLAGRSSLSLEDPDWYLGNGGNELHLAEQPALMTALEAAAAHGDTTKLVDLTTTIHLPCGQVSLYNEIPSADHLPLEARRMMSMAGMSLVGLPRVSAQVIRQLGLERAAAVRIEQDAFSVFGAPQMPVNLVDTAFAILRVAPDMSSSLLAVHNFSAQPLQLNGDLLHQELAEDGARELISGQHVAFTDGLTLSAYGFGWYCPEEQKQ